MCFKKCMLLAALLSFSLSAFSAEFMIIHTNDLHSYFDGINEKLGHYGRVKTIIDSLKEEAISKNIPSLVTDGGDWGEGTSFFYTNEGVDSIKLLDAIGVQVAVVGNHDHMFGGAQLSEQLDKAAVSTQFLSANIVQTQEMKLDKKVLPYYDTNFGNLRVRIIGLSTDEIHHQGAIVEEKGKIVDPIEIGCLQAKLAKKAGIDLVFALTHIGLKADRKLAKKCKNIDAIFGGHSHTRLDKIVFKNKLKDKTPIIQTGAHGHAVAKLVMDYDKDTKKLKVLEYQLIDANETIKKDGEIFNRVEEIKKERNALFKGEWDKIIGESKIPLYGYDFYKLRKKHMTKVERKNCWGEHMALLTAQTVKADFGVHLAAFAGRTIPKGALTFGDLIENYPHFKNFSSQGWEIGVVTAPGHEIKSMLRLLIVMSDYPGLAISGITYRGFRIPFTELTVPTRIKKIKKNEIYTVALPAVLYESMKLVVPDMAKKYEPFYKNSGEFYWPKLISYVKENSPLKCLND